MEPSNLIDPQLVEDHLDEKERELRQAFVECYMQTRDPVRACIQLGFLEPYAPTWAKQFMNEGYVLRLIGKATELQHSEDKLEQRKTQYRAWMEREANFTGKGSSHNARVSAIATLMKIDGMDRIEKDEGNVEHRGGVMMVPMLTDPDSWGKSALESQTSLKESVKD